MGFEETQTYSLTFGCVRSRWFVIQLAMSAYDHNSSRFVQSFPKAQTTQGIRRALTDLRLLSKYRAYQRAKRYRVYAQQITGASLNYPFYSYKIKPCTTGV